MQAGKAIAYETGNTTIAWNIKTFLTQLGVECFDLFSK